MTIILKLTDLQKRLGKFDLGPINLEIEQGTTMGFIGPNGAGKSTTIHCILGLLKPNKGSIEVCETIVNPNDADWKKSVGFVLSQQGFYERLTVADNLNFIASFYDDWDTKFADSLLKRFQLNSSKKVNLLSTGDRVKLALIGALGHRPRLILMDEPTSGLDPIVRAELIEVISEIMKSGDHSVFMSTHILADVSAVADRLAFINNGKLVVVADKDSLMEKWRRISFRSTQLVADFPGAVKAEHEGSLHLVTTCDAEATIAFLKRENMEIFESNRLPLEEISVHILRGASV
jgi:ABC-2 type transport system ATP-binding protein